MAEHIICITASGGIPLLTRTKSGCTSLPFPVIGSLNGVHMFGLNRDVKLLSTITENYRLVWKMYHDSVVLIAVAPTLDHKNQNQIAKEAKNPDSAMHLQLASQTSSSTVPDLHLFRLLDNVFNSLVLLTGLDELKNIRNVERLKKDLRACYKIVDTFLDAESDLKQSEELSLFGGITHSVDVVLSSESNILQDHLQAFVEAAESSYGCLVYDGKVVCATKKWWLLDGQELALLGRLICILPSSVTSCDIPVFLPYISPDVPYRLLVFTLVVGKAGGMRACVLCGPEPSLTRVQETLIEKFWGPATDTLQKCCRVDNIPDSIKTSLPSDLLGFLLINTKTKKCLSNYFPAASKDAMNRRKKLTNANSYESAWIHEKLLQFYKYTVGTSIFVPEREDTSPSDLSPHTGLAHYRCLKRHKCFALVKSQYQLFSVYSIDAPTFALRGLTERVLDCILKEGFV